jgi:hypothetical protein
MSEHFHTPEERGIVIGLAVTFVFPMSAWMSSELSNGLGLCRICLLTRFVYLSRLLPCQVCSQVPDRVQSRHRLCLGFARAHTRLPMAIHATIEQQEDEVMQQESDEETKTGGGMVKGELASVPTLRV